MKRHLLFTAVIATIMLTSTFTANAATLHDDNTIGFTDAKEEIINRVTHQIKDVPQEVVDLHRTKGGKIEFLMDSSEEAQNMNAEGLFYYRGENVNNIKVKVYEDMFIDEDSIHAEGYVLIHELGHFIYYTLIDHFEVDDFSEVFIMYDEKKDVRRDCYTVAETFAVMYKLYKVAPHELKQSEIDYFAWAEQFIIDKYNSLGSEM